jgi:hypothetical protein
MERSANKAERFSDCRKKRPCRLRVVCLSARRRLSPGDPISGPDTVYRPESNLARRGPFQQGKKQPQIANQDGKLFGGPGLDSHILHGKKTSLSGPSGPNKDSWRLISLTVAAPSQLRSPLVCLSQPLSKRAHCRDEMPGTIVRPCSDWAALGLPHEAIGMDHRAGSSCWSSPCPPVGPQSCPRKTRSKRLGLPPGRHRAFCSAPPFSRPGFTTFSLFRRSFIPALENPPPRACGCDNTRSVYPHQHPDLDLSTRSLIGRPDEIGGEGDFVRGPAFAVLDTSNFEIPTVRLNVCLIVIRSLQVGLRRP